MKTNTVLVIPGISARAVSNDHELLRAEVARQAARHDLSPPLIIPIQWGHLSDLPDTGLISDAADLVGDVLRYSADTALRRDTAAVVRDALQLHPGAVVAAHSLGSVILLDLFWSTPPKQLRQWGPRALLTMGSPLGLTLYRNLVPAGPRSAPTWRDIWALGDPIVTGHPLVMKGSPGLEAAGYPCRSEQLDLGTNPFEAHAGYWGHPLVARRLLSILGGER